MSGLPVVERELLVRARQARTQWTRVLVAGFAAVTIVFLFVGRSGGAADMTRMAGLVFRVLACAGFLGASVGFLFTVDCLSSERRAGTLGLLMVSRIGGVEILFGKLASNGLAAAYGLIALTPALMLPVLAGGVIGAQVVRVVAACASMLVFTLCLGLHASSQSKRFGEALTRVVVWFGFVMMATLIAGACPVGAFVDSDPSSPSSVGGGFWPGVCSGPALGLLFLGLAARSLRSNWNEHALDRPVAAPVSLDSEGEPRRIGDVDPVVWLLKRDGVRLFVIWMAAGLSFLSTVLDPGVARFGSLGSTGAASAVVVLTGIAAAGLFSYAGARFMMRLRQTGMFELLHATSIGIGRLGTIQWSVLRGDLFVPLLLLLSLKLVQRMGTPSLGWSSGFHSAGLGLFLVLSGPILVVMNALALCWLGMWFGLRSRSLLAGIFWSVGLVLGLDLATQALFTGLYAAWVAAANSGVAPSAWLAFVTMVTVPLVCIVKQIWLVLWARKQLNRRLVGGAFELFDLRRASRALLAGVQRARHWTPGRGT